VPREAGTARGPPVKKRTHEGGRGPKKKRGRTRRDPSKARRHAGKNLKKLAQKKGPYTGMSKRQNKKGGLGKDQERHTLGKKRPNQKKICI